MKPVLLCTPNPNFLQFVLILWFLHFWYNLLYYANREEIFSVFIFVTECEQLFSLKHHGVYHNMLKMGILHDFHNSTVFQIPI